MRIAVFCENILSASGGAEVYALKLAEVLLEIGEVIIFTVKNKNTIDDIDCVYEKYNVKKLPCKTIWLKHTKIIPVEIFRRIIFWFSLKHCVDKKFDCFINCSHNRLIGFKSIYSIHLVHFPRRNYTEIFPIFIGKLFYKKYINSYKLFISNSSFTQFYLKKEWNCRSVVLYPPINMDAVNEEVLSDKEKYILMVGRIVPDKCLLEMVMFFNEYKNDAIFNRYTLIIAGNKDPLHEDYFDKLKYYEKTGRVRIISDLKYTTLVELYKKSEIFLHAKGFNVNDDKPFNMEHFGMTTVEAMANGCIPIVINKGGQKEIVQHGVNGFLWNSTDEIIKVMEYLKICDIRKFQLAAVECSKKFLLNVFRKRILHIYQKYIKHEKLLK